LVAIVLNRASGTAADVDVNQLLDQFRSAGVDAAIVQFEPDEPLRSLGAMTNARPQAVVAAGGDGTVSAVAAALADTGIPLAVLPFGTLNHFAKDVGLPFEAAAAIRAISAGHTRRIDIGEVNGHVFINNSSIGVYTSFVERREELRRQGHQKWMASIIAARQAVYGQKELDARIIADGREFSARTPFLFVGNNEYAVEGIHIGSRSRLDGGRLQACAAPRTRTRDLPGLFFASVLGQARAHGAFTVLSARELWVYAAHERTLAVAADGEIVELRAPLHYRIRPAALTVIADEA
jgi:diacylglycerol kinase family enzyme